MSFLSWVKDLFSEEVEQDKIMEQIKEHEVKKDTDYDYSMKIFELKNRDDLQQVTSYILQDKTLALIKMHKFTGDNDDLKDTLIELKQTCENCNGRILGVTNNMFLVVKNSVEIVRE